MTTELSDERTWLINDFGLLFAGTAEKFSKK